MIRSPTIPTRRLQRAAAAVEQINGRRSTDAGRRAARPCSIRAARRCGRGNYPKAVQILTKLQRQPDFPSAPRFRVARPRPRALPAAKWRMRRPNTRNICGAIPRDLQRPHPRCCGFCEPPPRRAQADWIRVRKRPRLEGVGGASQVYRRDSFGTDSTDRVSTIVQNAIFTDADLFVHKDGERFTTGFPDQLGYAKTFLPRGIRGVEDRVRITTAFLDLGDNCWALTRVGPGRQLWVRRYFWDLPTASPCLSLRQSWSRVAPSHAGPSTPVTALRPTARFETLAVILPHLCPHWDSSVYVTHNVRWSRDRQQSGRGPMTRAQNAIAVS